MHLRALTIADIAGDVVRLAVVNAAAEVQLIFTHFGRKHCASIEAVAVVAAANTADIIGEHAGIDLEIALLKGTGNADPTLESEGIGEGGTLEEGAEARARQLFERLEVIVLTKADRGLFALPLEIGFREFDFVAGEIGFELIGERSEAHTTELHSLMRISYAVFCL